MPNQMPLSTAVNAAGGYLVEPALGDALIEKVQRSNAALQMAGDVQRITTNRFEWPVYLGRPTAAFVGEAAPKPATGAEFGQLILNIKKIATTVLYTTEVLEDARIDPQVLVNPDVEAAFGDLIDRHIIGTHAGGADVTPTFTTSFNAALANTTQTVELGTGSDAFALALSQAMGVLEGNGYEPNGVLSALDARGHLRDARDTQGRPLYTDNFQDANPTLYGLQARFTSNMDGFPAGLVGGAGSPAKTVAIVGDFTNLKVRIRRDLYTQTFREATINGVNLAETNQVAVQWEMRLGAQVFDLNRSFVRITNAA